MQKNLYYRRVLRRRNAIGEAITNFFLNSASFPRLLLEVFIRKNFGDRYFSLASIITLAILLVFGPWALMEIASGHSFRSPTLGNTIMMNKSWYFFTALFIVFSSMRYIEMKKNPSVFDFGRFSLSSGDIHPFFRQIRISGKKPSIRLIETVYEPIGFLVFGFLLIKMDQMVGYLLFTTSILYSLSYVGAYKRGDDFIKDKIDEMILNEELKDTFIKDEDNNKRGVRFRADKPASLQMRKDLAEEFVVDEKGETAEAF